MRAPTCYFAEAAAPAAFRFSFANVCSSGIAAISGQAARAKTTGALLKEDTTFARAEIVVDVEIRPVEATPPGMTPTPLELPEFAIWASCFIT